MVSDEVPGMKAHCFPFHPPLNFWGREMRTPQRMCGTEDLELVFPLSLAPKLANTHSEHLPGGSSNKPVFFPTLFTSGTRRK